MYTSYNVAGHYVRFTNGSDYAYIDTEFGYSYLKLNNMLRFRYPVNQFFLYANAGISNGWTIRENNYGREELMSLSIGRVNEGQALAATRKYEQGYLAGLGTQFKRYSLEIRYERGNGISAYSRLNSTTKRFYLSLKYSL